MQQNYAEITFDFDENYTKEKEIFLAYLSSEHWINQSTDRCWKIGFKKDIIERDQFKIIENDIQIASKISNIKKVDYAVILKETFFIGSIN